MGMRGEEEAVLIEQHRQSTRPGVIHYILRFPPYRHHLILSIL